MAEYLHNTVTELERCGINDRLLWRLQDMVAERIGRAGQADHRRVQQWPAEFTVVG